MDARSTPERDHPTFITRNHVHERFYRGKLQAATPPSQSHLNIITPRPLAMHRERSRHKELLRGKSPQGHKRWTRDHLQNETPNFYHEKSRSREVLSGNFRLQLPLSQSPSTIITPRLLAVHRERSRHEGFLRGRSSQDHKRWTRDQLQNETTQLLSREITFQEVDLGNFRCNSPISIPLKPSSHRDFSQTTARGRVLKDSSKGEITRRATKDRRKINYSTSTQFLSRETRSREVSV